MQKSHRRDQGDSLAFHSQQLGSFLHQIDGFNNSYDRSLTS
jgi:hypothetical protein